MLISCEASGPLTHSAGERFVQSFRNSAYAANDYYQGVFPGITHFDVVQGVAHVPAGSTIEHIAGLGGYVRVDDGESNGCALFGLAIAAADGAAAWPINWLATDDMVRGATGGLDRILSAEGDYNANHVKTMINGLTLGGNSTCQPEIANGFVINKLGNAPDGSTYRWKTGFFSQNGAAIMAVACGAMKESGYNVPSQKVLMTWLDGEGIPRTAQLQATAGFMCLTGSHLAVQGGDVFANGYRVGGDVVMAARVTGFSAMAGAANKNGGAINADTITATDADIRALAAFVKALSDASLHHGSIGA